MEDDVDEEEPIANGAPKKARGRPPKASKIGKYSVTPGSGKGGGRFFPLPPTIVGWVEGGGLPPHELALKVGCPVICLRNMDNDKREHETNLNQ